MIPTAVGIVSHSNDAHWLLRDVGSQHFHVSSSELVCPQDSSPHPVRPEYVVSVHGQTEWMNRFVLQQDLMHSVFKKINMFWCKSRIISTTSNIKLKSCLT